MREMDAMFKRIRSVFHFNRFSAWTCFILGSVGLLSPFIGVMILEYPIDSIPTSLKSHYIIVILTAYSLFLIGFASSIFSIIVGVATFLLGDFTIDTWSKLFLIIGGTLLGLTQLIYIFSELHA
jgi:uncharacterized membrane protein